MTSGIKGSQTNLSEASFACSVLPLQHKIWVLQATTECCGTLQQGYELVHFVAVTIQLSLLLGWPWRNTDEATMQVNLVPLAGNFASGVGRYAELVELLLWITTHPQLWGLELRTPMGTCLGQYSNYKLWVLVTLQEKEHNDVINECTSVYRATYIQTHI